MHVFGKRRDKNAPSRSIEEKKLSKKCEFRRTFPILISRGGLMAIMMKFSAAVSTWWSCHVRQIRQDAPRVCPPYQLLLIAFLIFLFYFIEFEREPLRRGTCQNTAE